MTKKQSVFIIVGIVIFIIIIATAVAMLKRDAGQHNGRPAVVKMLSLTPAKPISSQHNQIKHATLALYTQPNSHSAVVKPITLETPLVTIFHQPHSPWVKVGDTMTGTTGWLNIHAYRKAHHTLAQSLVKSQSLSPQSSTVYVVYQNGHKVMGDRAKALYERMLQQQKMIDESVQFNIQPLILSMEPSFYDDRPNQPPVWIEADF